MADSYLHTGLAPETFPLAATPAVQTARPPEEEGAGGCSGDEAQEPC